MHIKEGLVFDKHSGELIDFTSLGEMNDHIANLEKAGGTQTLEPLAKSMLVLMVGDYRLDLSFRMHNFPAPVSPETSFTTSFGRLLKDCRGIVC